MNLIKALFVIGLVMALIGIWMTVVISVSSLTAENETLKSELLTYDLSVVDLEAALEQQGLALDEVVLNYNNCLKANPGYMPYEWKIEDGKLWWRMDSGEWKLQGEYR